MRSFFVGMFLAFAAAGAAQPAPGLDLVLVVDRSGSMHAIPNAALATSAELLQRDAASARVIHRLGIVSFGSTPRLDLPLTPAADPDVIRRIAAITSAPTLGDTDIAAALFAAARLLRINPHDETRRRAIVLMTDGLPDTPPSSSRTSNDALRAAVEALPPDITLEVVLMRSRNGSRADGSLWQSLAAGRKTLARAASTDAAPALLRVVTRLAGTRSVETVATRNATIVVPPYLELVVFDIFGDGVSLFGPEAKNAVRAGDEGIEQFRAGRYLTTIAVRRPRPGRWRFHLEDPDARVTIFSEQFFPRGELVEPPHASSRPDRQTTIAYRLVDSEGSPFSVLPRYPFTLDLTLICPDGDRSLLAMSAAREQGFFRTAAPASCTRPGRYWTEVAVRTIDVDGRPLEVFRDHWSGFHVTASAAEQPRARSPIVTAAAVAIARSSPPQPSAIEAPIADARTSLAQRIGLPDAFQTALLTLALLLALSPYLAGVTVGNLQIPQLAAKHRRQLRFAGPAAVAGAILLVLPLTSLAPRRQARLAFVAVDATPEGEIDVAVTNDGNAPVLITRIELEVLRDRGRKARPTLLSAAAYRIPIDDLQPGQRRSVIGRQLIAPGTTERFTIAPQTARALDVRLHLKTADGLSLSRDLSLWPSPG